ncbi:hypothetical protein B0A53_03453 [Rhodotorula sp. CCFEE 5036]|nr:hypothetical protein B0A53_03453 [Rhodotorula sp. CCFEE 5036]
MATLERSIATRDGPAERVNAAFDPTAVPLDPAPLTQLSRHSHVVQPEHARAVQEQDLIDLGREQLFAGSTRAASTGQRRRDRQQDVDSRTVPASAPQAVAEQSQDAMNLLVSLRAARQAFVSALDSVIREALPTRLAETPLSADAATNTGLAPLVDASSDAVSSSPQNRLSSASTQMADDDVTLMGLLRSLRARQPSAERHQSPSEMQSAERSSPLDARRSRPPSATLTVLDEVQSRLDQFAPEDWLLPTDAELARSLVSLLACLQRLADLSGGRDLGSEPSGHVETTLATGRRGDQTLGATLERGASALLGSSRGSFEPPVAGVLRAVEHAERDLLWGRVDDLSERLRLLSHARVLEVFEQDAADSSLSPHRSPEPPIRYSLDGASGSDLPPQYSQHAGPSHAHLPPAYVDDGMLRDNHFDLAAGESKHAAVEAGVDGAPLRTRTRKVSTSAHSEKMRRDLDGVTEAIERLYVVSPQLANQRVEPDRRALRERQLANLGNAIERLNQGRLNDQRAAPVQPLPQASRLAHAGVAERPSSAGLREDTKAFEDHAFERMLDQIDKAARRTLADQRVELNGKRKAPVADPSVQARLDALFDRSETSRRDFILQHTGKGRLAAQDAVFRSSSASIPEGSDRTFATRDPFAQASPSTTRDLLARPQSAPADGRFDIPSADTNDANTSWKSLKRGLLKRAPGSRRCSQDVSAALEDAQIANRSRPGTSTHVLPHAEVDSIVELSRNLGTLHVSFWPRRGIAGGAPFKIVALEDDAILVAPEGGRPASRIALPCRVPQQEVELAAVDDGYEARLTVALGSPALERPDLEIRTPLMADELRSSMPTSYRCSVCDVELVQAASITRYNALPSEHWAELIDAWMCHQDQALSDDLIAKGKGIKPRPDEGLVSNTYLLFPSNLVRNCDVQAEKQP